MNKYCTKTYVRFSGCFPIYSLKSLIRSTEVTIKVTSEHHTCSMIMGAWTVLLVLLVACDQLTAFVPRIHTSQLWPSKTIAKMMMSVDRAPSTLSTPPSTFIDCTRQAARAAELAIRDGNKLIEVEFPPLPLQYLEDSSSSARDIADANTRWAIEFARKFNETGKVSIIYPDQPELDDAVKYLNLGGGCNPFPNVTLATIRSDSIKNAGSLDMIIASVFGATVGGTVVGIPNTSVYVALISSTQELTDLEKLHELDPNVPIVFFNLRLDILVRIVH